MNYFFDWLFPNRGVPPLWRWVLAFIILGILFFGMLGLLVMLIQWLSGAGIPVSNIVGAIAGLIAGVVIAPLVLGVSLYRHWGKVIEEGQAAIIVRLTGQKTIHFGPRFILYPFETYKVIDMRPRVTPMNFEARTRDNLKVKVFMVLEWQPVHEHILTIDQDPISQETRVQDWISLQAREFVRDNNLDDLIGSPWYAHQRFHKRTASLNIQEVVAQNAFFRPLRINALDVKPPEEFDTLFKQRKLIDLKTKLVEAEAQLKRAEFKMEETLAENARISEFHSHLLKNKARANEIKTIDRIINEANPRTLEHIENMEQAKSKSG